MDSNYKIKDGDTLTRLAKKFGTTVAVLAKANNIEDPDKIYIGDNIMIPDPRRQQMQQMVQQMLQQQRGQQGAGQGPQGQPQMPIPQQLTPPQGMTTANTPMPQGGSPIPSPQSQALQGSHPEMMMGVPGMMRAAGGAAMGGLGGLARGMPQQMAQAGRMQPPAGYSNIVPMGNSGGANSSMAQAMLNSKGGLGHPAANVMRQQRTQSMGSPEHQLAQMMGNSRYPINPGVRHNIGGLNQQNNPARMELMRKYGIQ